MIVYHDIISKVECWTGSIYTRTYSMRAYLCSGYQTLRVTKDIDTEIRG